MRWVGVTSRHGPTSHCHRRTSVLMTGFQEAQHTRDSIYWRFLVLCKAGTPDCLLLVDVRNLSRFISICIITIANTSSFTRVFADIVNMLIIAKATERQADVRFG